MEIDAPASARGVLYALAGFSGGITSFMKDGYLCYEFNLFEVERTRIRSKNRIPAGKHTIEVESKLEGPIGGPMDVTLKVDGAVVGQGTVPRAMSLHFTSNRDRFEHRRATSIAPVSRTTTTWRPFRSTGPSAGRRSATCRSSAGHQGSSERLEQGEQHVP